MRIVNNVLSIFFRHIFNKTTILNTIFYSYSHIDSNYQRDLKIIFDFPIFQTYLEKLIAMREIICQNCKLNKDSEPSLAELTMVGDRGYVLWLYLETMAIGRSTSSQNTALVKKHLDFWTRYYNYRYVLINYPFKNVILKNVI